MKAQSKGLVILFLAYCAAVCLHAQGYIVPNGVSFPGFNGLGYETRVLQNPTNSDYTGFLLTPQNASTFQFAVFLDEGVRTFLVSSNASISLQPIQANAYTELNSPNNYTFADGMPFYLAFYTGYTPVNGVYNDPSFGWGLFVNNSGTIQMLDSALAHGGGGIYAGTDTLITIPEPNALTLAAFGVLLFAAMSKREANHGSMPLR